MLTAPKKWPVHAQDEIDAVSRVLASGKTNYWTGDECRHFEKEFAEHMGCAHAIAVMNGTVALEAALQALAIGPLDEVITTPRTFIASASSIVMRGAIPILADVDPDSQNIMPATISPCISDRTKAIIVVHLAGWPADMPGILALARAHNLRVIEDCAQAHGATINNRAVGTWGDVGAFSFCQDKIITTGGEGGMVTTNNAALWEKIWSYKDHGKNHHKVTDLSPAPGFRWLHDSFGTNGRMTEMQSAIGRLQLKKLPDWLSHRRRNAAVLTDTLQELSAVRIPQPPEGIQHAFYKYYLFIRPEKLKSGWSRDAILKEANRQGIPCFSGSCSEIYLEQAFASQPQRATVTRKNARLLGETSLMLPVDPSFDTAAMQKMADGLRTLIRAASL